MSEIGAFRVNEKAGLNGGGALTRGNSGEHGHVASKHLVFAPKGYAMRHRLDRALMERDGGPACFYCGGHANSVDHVTPRYLGGSDGIDNLVLACWDCNDEKNTTPGWLFVLHKTWDYHLDSPYLDMPWWRPPSIDVSGVTMPDGGLEERE